MHPNPTALVLEQLPSGAYAWLRASRTAEEKAKFIPRDQLPRFVVQTQTVYVVYAPTAAAALSWFDLTASDVDIDTEIMDFGKVEVFGQLSPEDTLDDGEPRYVLTDLGRRAVAESRCRDQGPTVAELIAAAV